MTAFLTVVFSVVVFVLGQLCLKLVIGPINDLRKTIGAISHALIKHGAVIGNHVPPRSAAIVCLESHQRWTARSLR